MAVDWKHLIVHRLLNLPERDTNPPKAVTTQASPAAAAQADPGRNPWVAAAATRPAETTSHGGGERSITTATEVPWRIADEPRSVRTWRRAGRTAVVVVLVLFAWVGVRTTFFPAAAPEAPPLPVALTFDSEAAEGVATRFVVSALTWNEDKSGAHAQAVALDYAGGRDDLGWNGKGRQDVTQAIPAGVVVLDERAAVVTVLVRTVTSTRNAADEPWKAGEEEWSTVQVPVAVVDGRMVATGAPGLTGQVAPGRPARTPAAKSDEALTKSTRDGAQAFFVAYGEGDVSAVESPGARIVAPGDRWEFSALVGWQVYDGSGETREATATVTWAVPGEPQTYTVTYSVTLSKVSGGGADRWQVSNLITGSSPSHS